jgi:lysyl-tRNA synthetase class 2
LEETESQVLKQRRQKARELAAMGVHLYPNHFRVEQTVEEVLSRFGHLSAEELKSEHRVVVAGRLMSLRSFGKAVFAHIQDGGEQIQIYVMRDEIGSEPYALFKKLDVGDFIGVRGRLFRTSTGELTILAQEITLLCKSLRPLPEKYHWLTDKELRYRQRYLDLIGNREVREVFIKRTRLIQALREFMDEKGFLEVETPMMQSIAGGATARPFETFHNALGIPLYLRVAPELFLKRLLVGGFNKVYEINRNFRNEGISTKHNPEFTMLEFYQAYATYEDLMALTEELIGYVAEKVNGSLHITYQGHEIDLSSPWKRVSLKEALSSVGKVDEAVLSDLPSAKKLAESMNIQVAPGEKHGKILTKIFDLLVEPYLIQPTFVTHYPTEVSPLARRNEQDPTLVDRFELFIGGREIANAFSELNDPLDQRERFELQVSEREAGDEEAHVMDQDYIIALEHGMPPAAGEGIGVDRLVMLFTDMASIRDVILFPHMRPVSVNQG